MNTPDKDQTNTAHAIILAAGEGKRLRPLTETTPKCLAEVNGCSILENALAALSARGVKTASVVVGHLASVVESRIGSEFRGMDIEFVQNPDFATTNSMYSLHLGLQHKHEATWVFEGDVFFEDRILTAPVPREISWFVDSSRKDLDGAYIGLDAEGRATSLQIIRDTDLLHAGLAKSIGILHLSATGVTKIKHWLRQGVAANQTNLYYDLILADHLGEAYVEVVEVRGAKWFEIDNLSDLENAGRLFK